MRHILKKTIIAVSLAVSTFASYDAQNIYTYAGSSTSGYGGDGGLATNAKLNSPTGLTLDAAGNLFVCDYSNNRIRKISTSGIITTVVGTGVAGFSGDGGQATAAKINGPISIVCDQSGNLFFTDNGNNRIRKVNSSGVISTIAGVSTAGYSGDGGAAISAQMDSPVGIAIDASGNLYFTDSNNQRVRKITSTGTISLFAGNGQMGFAGDGGLALNAQMSHPRGIAVDAAGNVYISDIDNSRVRKVDASWTITTYAGTGTAGFSGDGGPATAANLNFQYGVTIDASNNLYIGDRFNNRIRQVNGSGTISTIAGTGVAGFSGDGGLATNAQLSNPYAIAINSSGDIFVCDNNNQRIRKICASNCTAGLKGEASNDFNVSIYPNPSNGVFNLEIPYKPENCKFILLNVLGKKIYQCDVDHENNKITFSGVSPGLYNYIILLENQIVKTGRLTFE